MRSLMEKRQGNGVEEELSRKNNKSWRINELK